MDEKKNEDLSRTEPVIDRTVVLDRTAFFDREPENREPAPPPTKKTRILTSFFSRSITRLGLKPEIPFQEKAPGFTADEKVCQEQDATEETLTLLEDRISIDREFASGGQGILSVGIDRSLHRKVAVKELRPELCDNPEMRKNFLSEAWITAQLEHPAIVPVHSLHRKGEKGLAVTMKLIHGKALTDYLNELIRHFDKHGLQVKEESKSLRYRIDIFLKVCDALEYAHSRNLMHCDLKPENIMIGEYHEVYLMDWGIARPIRNETYNPEHWVVRKQIAGSVKYLSPEVVRGEYSDQRSDVYSMGLILFEIVTLNEAFSGTSMNELLHKVHGHKLNAIRHRFGFPVSSDLKAIIRKATAFPVKDRYQSMAEFASDVRKLLRNEEVSANPDNLFRKLFRFCIVRHGLSTVITALAGLLCIVGFSAFTLWKTLQSERIDTARQTLIEKHFVSCLDGAYTLDNKLVELEHALSACAGQLHNISVRRKLSDKGVSKVFDCTGYEDPQKRPAEYRFFPHYGFALDYEHTGCLVPETASPESRERRLRVAGLLFSPMQKVILQSFFHWNQFSGSGNNDQLLNWMKLGRMAATQVYFAFNDGFFLCYPGKSHTRKYDPRKRLWYRNRIAPEAPASGWSAPYLESSGNDLVITYTLRLKRCFPEAQEGIGAIDVSLAKFFEFVCNCTALETAAGVVEKAFIDRSGAVIVSSDPLLNARLLTHYRRSLAGGSSGFLYPQSQLLKKIRWSSKGSIKLRENGRDYIYVFSRCSKINGYLIKKIDLSRGIEAMLSHRN